MGVFPEERGGLGVRRGAEPEQDQRSQTPRVAGCRGAASLFLEAEERGRSDAAAHKQRA